MYELIDGRTDQYIGRELMLDTRPTILVDLDRTLLDTDSYTAELWNQVAKLKPGVSTEEELAQVRRGGFYQPLGTTHTQGAYSFKAHVRDLLVRRGEAADEFAVRALLEQVQEAFPDASACLYDGAEELISEMGSIGDVSILTFGIAADQENKLKRLPTLANTPAIIIQEDKASYISREFENAEEVWLIDDRDYPGMPENCRSILIDHRADTEASGSGIPVVHNLAQAVQIIKGASHYEKTN